MSAHEAFVTIPTLGNRPSLWPLIRNAGLPVMLVWTGPMPAGTKHWPLTRELPGCPEDLWDHDITTVVDHGPINIHRWWNRGFELASSRALSVGVIVNDDVRAAPGALAKLADEVTGDVVLAYPDAPTHSLVRCTPITGYCFATRVRPDLPAFQGCEDDSCHHWNPHLRWWYGEHDLELRVMRNEERSGRTMRKAVPGLDIEHLRRDWRYDRQDEISPLIKRDREVFNARWADKVGVQ